MLVQDQHSLLNIGIKELKALLFGKKDESKSYINDDGNLMEDKTEYKDHEEILNKELGIYLVANITAKTMYYRRYAHAVVTVDLHFGARTWYFDEIGKPMPKALVHSDVISITESARQTMKKKHDLMIQEEWQRKEGILSGVIGPRRTLKLERPPLITDSFYIDRYTGTPTTTVEEREQLAKLGLIVSIDQEG